MFDGDWRDVRALGEAIEAAATRRVLRRDDYIGEAVAHVARRT